MKKNTMMRLASFLLIAVLISTSAISGTYAKYVTEGSASDTARVAKWGVDFQITGGPLFNKTYSTDNKTEYAAMTYSVKADENVVAPGSAGQVLKFTTTGVPEVSYVVSFDVADTIETIYLLADEEGKDISYYPIAFTLSIGGKEVSMSNMTANTIAAAIENCAYYFDVTDGVYRYTTNYTEANPTWTASESNGKTIPSLELNWSWDFDDNGAGTNDAYDTILGNLAASETYTNINSDKYNLDVNISVTATATQID